MNEFLPTINQQVGNLISQKNAIDSVSFGKRADKLKQILEQKIHNAKREISENRRTYKQLKAEYTKEIPLIAKEDEWARLFNAYTKMITDVRPIDQTKNDELMDFHQQIASTVEKQTKRLQKLKKYSKSLRENRAKAQATHSSNRSRRITQAQNIFEQFEQRTKNEQKKNYDKYMDAERQKTKELIDEETRLKNKISEVTNSVANLQESITKEQKKILELEDTLQKQKNAIDASSNIVLSCHEELKKRIQEYQNKINDLSVQSMDYDELIKKASSILNLINTSQQIATKIFE